MTFVEEAAARPRDLKPEADVAEETEQERREAEEDNAATAESNDLPGGLHPDADEERAADAAHPEGREIDPEFENRLRRAEMLDGVREVRRFEASGLEVRQTTDGILRFTGYASVTEHPYEVADFTEVISRGAFRRSLSEDPDVVLLVNHEGLPLARTKSGTLTLAEDARGLRVDADLNPEDPDVQALVPKLRRGDVGDMSFAFRATAQDWNEDYTERTIKGVAIHRGDVSIVTMGANDAAAGSVVARSDDGVLELRAGKAISSANADALTKALNLVARADEAVDAAQPIIAGVLGVPNPDSEESSEPEEGSAADDDTRAAEPEAEAKVIPLPLPDHTTRARERLATLRRHR